MASRGDLQYKEVKISAKKLLENVGSLLPKKQLVYIATDVKQREYFDDMLVGFPNVHYITPCCLHSFLLCAFERLILL